MRTIILYGHQCTAQAAFMHIDSMLHERQLRDIVLVQTVDMDQPTAHALRDAGGELWYCGPTLTPPGACGWSPTNADRYLLADCFEKLGPKVTVAFGEFMNKTRVAA